MTTRRPRRVRLGVWARPQRVGRVDPRSIHWASSTPTMPSIDPPTDPRAFTPPSTRKSRMEPRIRPRRRRPRPGWLPLLLLSTSVAGAAAAAATSSHHAAAFTPHTSRPPPRPPRRRPPSQLSALGSSTTNDDDAPRYAARGVSAYKGEVLAAVAPPPSPPQGQQPQGQPPPLLPSLYPDAFCRLVPDVLTGSPEHALVMHADGGWVGGLVDRGSHRGGRGMISRSG